MKAGSCHRAALVVCFPRLYFGFHYLTDLLAGAALGVGLTRLVIALPWPEAPLRGFARLQRHASALLLLAVFLIAYERITLFATTRGVLGAVKDVVHALDCPPTLNRPGSKAISRPPIRAPLARPPRRKRDKARDVGSPPRAARQTPERHDMGASTMTSTTVSTTPNSRLAQLLRAAGLVLLVIGLAGYVLPAGPVHWTALIPAILGALSFGASLLRNPWVAAGLGATVCAIALMGGGTALPQLPALLAGEAGPAIASRAATAIVAILTLAGLAYALITRRRSS